MTFIEPTYLYLKRHLDTGLLYFGKIRATSKLCRSLGIDGYLGSGSYWTQHIKIHGKNIETLWYCLFTVEEEELVEFALAQSIIMDIVKLKIDGKKVFANLIEENGVSGTPKGILYQEERKRQCSERHWARNYEKEQNPNYGSTRTEDQKKRMQISQKKRDAQTRVGVKMQKEARERLSTKRRGKINISEEKMKEKKKLYDEILKLFSSRPELHSQHEVGKQQRNGKVLTYERQFQKEYADVFNLTSVSVYNIIVSDSLLLKL